jgi:hypothetical protein
MKDWRGWRSQKVVLVSDRIGVLLRGKRGSSFEIQERLIF